MKLNEEQTAYMKSKNDELRKCVSDMPENAQVMLRWVKLHTAMMSQLSTVDPRFAQAITPISAQIMVEVAHALGVTEKQTKDIVKALNFMSDVEGALGMLADDSPD